MKIGDLVKVYGTYPALTGVVVSLGWNENFKDSEEIKWNPNPDVHVTTKYGKRTYRMQTLELVNESR